MMDFWTVILLLLASNAITGLTVSWYWMRHVNDLARELAYDWLEAHANRASD